MDLTEFAMAGFMIVGLVNGVQFAVNQEWKSFAYFLTGVTAGAVFGYLGYFGLPSTEIGIAVGLSSSGVYKATKMLAGK